MVFGLFGGISNKQIEEVVAEALSATDEDQKLLPAIEQVVRFADMENLGAWKRARFGVEALSWASRMGADRGTAKVLANTFDLFVQQREPTVGLDATAFQCGLDGAMQFAAGWPDSAYEHAGGALLEDFILNAKRRDVIERSYFVGWRCCGNDEFAKRMTHEFRVIAASVAHGGGDLDQESLLAWRRQEITTAAQLRYRKEKAAERESAKQPTP